MTTLKGLQGVESDGKVVKVLSPYAPQVGERLSEGIERGEQAAEVRLPEPLWTVRQVAKYLQIEDTTLYEWVGARKIPFRKVGRLLRFDPQEVLEWTRSGGCKHDRLGTQGKEADHGSVL